ncbi:MAG: hypothetical protein NVS3B26_26500 [Mycobacteriales bacterium]
MAEPALEPVYAAIFHDAIVVKVRDGQVGNRRFCAAIGVTLAGTKDVLGLAPVLAVQARGSLLGVLTDLRHRHPTRSAWSATASKGLPEAAAYETVGSRVDCARHRQGRPRARLDFPYG